MEGSTVDKMFKADLLDKLFENPQGLSTRDLSRALLLSKQDVNRALYRLRDEGSVLFRDGRPPKWFHADFKKADKEPKKFPLWTLVYIDLDNVHDCFENAAKFAGQGDIIVHGFSGPAYNHWAPPKKEPDVFHFSLGNPLKNATKLTMFIHIVDTLRELTTNVKITVVMVSKDKIVQTMADLLEDRFAHIAQFVCVKDWEELKMYL